MQDEFAEYREYLREGMRIEIGIPLSGGGVFREWAIVHASYLDEVLAEISRDILPDKVRVDVGSILDISVWIKKDVYSCSSIVIEKISVRLLKVRLFGSFTLRERRQFFRLDLPLRARYAVVEDQATEDVKRDWEHRLELEHMKFQGYDQVVIAAHGGWYQPSAPIQWQELTLDETSLGGGGLRLRLPVFVPPESLLNLEVLLPITPARVIHAVAEVIYVMAPRTQRGTTFFNTGLQFLYLDERDRDLIFQHISVRQIEYLKKHAETHASLELEKESAPEPLSWRRVMKRVLLFLLFLIAATYTIRYFILYQASAPSNEIQKTYERAIKQYRGDGPPK